MRWSLRLNRFARRVCRPCLSWRTARLFCAIWFLLMSVGLPFNLPEAGGQSCARNPGAQCRCSLKKRLSGTCCCKRESVPQVAKSCCSVKKSSPRTEGSTASACCSSKGPKHELSLSRCDCGSDSPESVSLAQEPRLPAAAAVISAPPATFAFLTLSVDRGESALLQPPAPPPKVVFS